MCFEVGNVALVVAGLSDRRHSCVASYLALIVMMLTFAVRDLYSPFAIVILRRNMVFLDGAFCNYPSR